MHEEATTTTTAASSKIASNIINPHQSIDGSIATTTTTTISIVHHLHHHPNATVIENYAASLPSSSSASNANLTSQIVSPQTKIIISNNALDDVGHDDCSSVILNGAIANPNEPNVLIVGTSSTCNNDKNEMTLSLEDAQQQHMEIEIVDAVASVTGDGSANDGSDVGEGELKFNLILLM